jgi:hypothetical protein
VETASRKWSFYVWVAALLEQPPAEPAGPLGEPIDATAT